MEDYRKNILAAINENDSAAERVFEIVNETFKSKGSRWFWDAIHPLLNDENPIVVFKLCFVLHKVLREGHFNSLEFSKMNWGKIMDLSKIWNGSNVDYGNLIAPYAEFLYKKIIFHEDFPSFHGSLFTRPSEWRTLQVNNPRFFEVVASALVEYFDRALVIIEKIIFTIAQKQSFFAALLPALLPLIEEGSRIQDNLRIIFFDITSEASGFLLEERQYFVEILQPIFEELSLDVSLEFIQRLGAGNSYQEYRKTRRNGRELYDCRFTAEQRKEFRNESFHFEKHQYQRQGFEHQCCGSNFRSARHEQQKQGYEHHNSGSSFKKELSKNSTYNATHQNQGNWTYERVDGNQIYRNKHVPGGNAQNIFIINQTESDNYQSYDSDYSFQEREEIKKENKSFSHSNYRNEITTDCHQKEKATSFGVKYIILEAEDKTKTIKDNCCSYDKKYDFSSKSEKTTDKKEHMHYRDPSVSSAKKSNYYSTGSGRNYQNIYVINDDEIACGSKQYVSKSHKQFDAQKIIQDCCRKVNTDNINNIVTTIPNDCGCPYSIVNYETSYNGNSATNDFKQCSKMEQTENGSYVVKSTDNSKIALSYDELVKNINGYLMQFGQDLPKMSTTSSSTVTKSLHTETEKTSD